MKKNIIFPKIVFFIFFVAITVTGRNPSKTALKWYFFALDDHPQTPVGGDSAAPLRSRGVIGTNKRESNKTETPGPHRTIGSSFAEHACGGPNVSQSP